MKKKITILLSMITILTLTLAGCGSSSNIAGNSVSYDDTYYNSKSDNSMAEMLDNVELAQSAGSSGMGFSLDSTKNTNNSTDEYYESVDTSLDIPKEDITTTNTSVNTTLYEEKLIYHSNVEVETKEYDTAYENLRQLIKKYNGIIESENFYNNNGSYLNNYKYSGVKVKRSVSMIVRIPTENFESFNKENEENGNVISKSSSVENITLEYYDTTATVQGLQAQLARLQELMKSATEVEDMITLNQEIYELEMTISRLTTQIRTMDMDVAYSYVNIKLNEVVEYSEIEEIKEDTFFNRLGDTVKNSMKGFGSFLEALLFLTIIILPYAIVIAVVIIIINMLFGKKIKAKRQEKRELIKALLGKTPVENNKVEDSKDESTK